jgi:hypothetical protein
MMLSAIVRTAILSAAFSAAGPGFTQTKPMPMEEVSPLAGVPYQLWRYRLAMSMPGMEAMAGLGDREYEVCNPAAAAGQCHWDPACRMTDLGREGLQQRLRVDCPDFRGEATMTWSADGRRWAGRFAFVLSGVAGPPGGAGNGPTMQIDAVYLRPCGAAEALR